MGDYATTTELIARFGSSEEAAYATDSESTGTASTSVLEENIGTAEGIINSKISARFLTPVDVSLDSSLAALLQGATLDMAEHYTLIRSPSSSDRKKEQHDFWITFFDDIRDGKSGLTGAVELPSTAMSDNFASWSGSDRELPDPGPRICSRETMGGL